MTEPIRATFSMDELDWQELESIAKKSGFDSRNKLIQSLVKSHLNGTTESLELTIKQKTDQAKLDLVLQRILNAKLDGRIKTAFADYVETYVKEFKTFPSIAGYRALQKKAKNDNVIKVTGSSSSIPYDKDAIYCTDCKWFTNSRDSTNSQINSLVGHMKMEHRRALTEEEAEELSRLLI